MSRIATQPLIGTSEPVFWLALIASALGLLVLLYIFSRRRASRRQLVERVAELEALSSAGRAIVASELDLDALIELIAQQAGQIIDTSTFQIGLFDDDFYEIRYWRINHAPQPTPQSFDLSVEGNNGPKGGLMGWIHDTGQPLLVRDFQQELNKLPAQPRYISEDPPRSALFIPLISGEQTLGVLAAQSAQPNRFSEQDLKRLTILANQAAAAIANGRLYAQAQMRVRHLELVGQIARQVNAVQVVDEIFEEVVTLTEATFGFHPVNIFAVDQEAGDVYIQATSLDSLHSTTRHGLPAPPDAVLPQQIRMSIGRGLVGTAAAERHTIVANNTADDHRFVAHLEALPPTNRPPAQAEIAIPLIVNNELLGVLDVQSPQLNAFGTDEQIVLEALADEVATAIHKAQQFGREQEQAWITTAQLQVAEAISRSRDLDEMYANVARLIPLLTGVSLAGFMLWDPEDETYQGAVLVNAAGDADETFDEVELEIGDWGALDAVHVGGQPISTTQVPNWLRTAAFLRSAVKKGCLRLYPLLSSQEQPLGVLLVCLEEGAGCDETTLAPIERAIARRQEELRLSLARQIAQALESAQLRIAQQEEAWVNTALLQVAEAVSSLTELNDILDSIVRLVPLLVGVDTVFVLTWDDNRQIFRAGPSYGVSAMGRGLVETLEIDRDEILAMSPQLAADLDGATGRAPAASHYPLRVPPWLQTVLATTTAHNFSLVAGGRLVGAMIVGVQDDRKGKRPFSTRRANILNGIAQQAATAVVNNQLYQESAERWRLQQELDVAHNIQTSFLPDKNPTIPGASVGSHWQAARQVSGDFFDFLPLDDDQWGIVIADVADKGVPAALFMALSRTILRTVALSRTDPAQVLMRANEIIGREARSDLFVTVFYGIWDPVQQRLSYANAGHNPPLLMQDNGMFRELPGSGIALGVIPEIQLKSSTVTLRPSETIILYTDGVTEALNEDFDEFGLDRLKLAARGAARKDAGAIVGAIIESVSDHVGGTPQFDDITLIALKRHREQSGDSG